MSNPKSNKKLIGKFFHTKYGYGDNHLEGWWAEQKGPTTVRIHRKNGTFRDMSEGETISSVSGSVQFLGDRVAVGDYVIPLFKLGPKEPSVEDYKPLSYSSLRARPVKSSMQGKKAFIVESEDGTLRQKVNEGDYFKPLQSEVELTDNNQLVAGNILIAVHPLEYEMNLVVFNEHLNGGFKAYFNRKVPGNETNMRDGIEGTFFPKKGKTPANFSEMSVRGGGLFKTGIFFETKNGKYSSGIVRTLETAERERFLYKKHEEMKVEAKETGFPLEDHPYYEPEEQVELSNLQNHKEGSMQGLFVVVEGANLITGEKPENQHQAKAPNP